jgi:AhpD family alkylhydroperoxidase
MARLPLLDPGTALPEAGALLQQIAGERGQAFNVYRLLANSPRVLEGMYGMASYLWQESALPATVVELVILRVAQLTKSDYEWARHRRLARRVGVRDEQVDALATWGAHDELFDADERVALALAEEVTRDVEAGAEAVQDVRDRLGSQAALEVVVLAGFYRMVSGVLRSFAVDAEPGDEPIPRVTS